MYVCMYVYIYIYIYMCTHVYMLSRFKNNVTAVLRGSGMFGTYGWYVRMVGTVFLVQPWYGRLVRTVFLGQPLVRTIGAYGFFLVQVLVQDIGTDGQKVLVSASLLALPLQFHRDHTHTFLPLSQRCLLTSLVNCSVFHTQGKGGRCVATMVSLEPSFPRDPWF